MAAKRIPVPTFREVLDAKPDALKELPKNTRSRYRNGEFPQVIRRLMAHPCLLRALADDAEHQREQAIA